MYINAISYRNTFEILLGWEYMYFTESLLKINISGLGNLHKYKFKNSLLQNRLIN